MTFLFIEPTFAQSKESKEGFRLGKWGESLYAIQSRETKAGNSILAKEKNVLAIETNIARESCIAVYLFTDNKLTAGRYVFDTEFFNTINSDNVVREYDHLYNLLSKKYGNPTEDNSKDDGEYKSGSKGDRIYYNHLSLAHKWVTEESVITLYAISENLHIMLRIDYSSKKYQDESFNTDML